MALSMVLQMAHLKADSIDTTCTITLDKEGDGYAIKKSHLDLTARIPARPRRRLSARPRQRKKIVPCRSSTTPRLPWT
jgi:osmotically inducible protein OsmC